MYNRILEEANIIPDETTNNIEMYANDTILTVHISLA